MSTPGADGRSDRAFTDVLADAHAGYHGETRLHRAPDDLVDDVVTYRMLSPHLMRALLFLVAPTVLLIIWLLLGYLASMSSPDPTSEAILGVVGFLVVVLYLAGVAAFFAPAKEPIAEYSQLLEGRGGAADTAYEWVRRAAAARRSPADVRSSTVAGVPVLVFSQRSERAMLLVQAYGEDLFVGWTMWRSRSSATLLVHFLRDTFGRLAPTPRFSAELRAASTRALRESVHSLSREGVVAAVHAHELAAGMRDAGGTGSWAATGHRDTGSWAAAGRRDGGDRQDDTGGWPTGVDPHAHDDTGWRAAESGGRRGEALPPAAPTAGPDAWTAGPWGGRSDAGLYAPRREARDDGGDGWGPPPRR